MIPIHPLKSTVSRPDAGRSTWLFSNQVEHLQEELLGDARSSLVWVQSAGCAGVYSKGPLIAVRLLPETFSDIIRGRNAVAEEELVKTFKAQLLALRESKQRTFSFADTEAFRWAHGDADGVPGLVIDDYISVVVIQSSSAAGDLILPWVRDALFAIDDRPLFERSSGQVRALEELPERTRWLRRASHPEDGKVTTQLASLEIAFVPEKAQKTGLFLDQRENLRHLLLSKVKAKTMLDICSYAGAWSCAGSKCGVSSFTLIDVDANALSLAEENIRRNSSNVEIVTKRHGDMFEELTQCKNTGARFDIVVADPPAFTKSKKHIEEARRAYARLTKAASRLVSDNGVYVACSCSRHISSEEFLDVIERNLSGSGWILLHKGEQSPDHTVTVPRSTQEYLKCFFFLKRTI